MTLFKSMVTQDKMLCTFMCEGYGEEESQLPERQGKRVCERESLRERRIAWVQRSGHSHKQLTET
jgi:hypothetical protein